MKKKKKQYVFKEFLPESKETPFPLTVYFNVYGVNKGSNNKNEKNVQLEEKR